MLQHRCYQFRVLQHRCYCSVCCNTVATKKKAARDEGGLYNALIMKQTTLCYLEHGGQYLMLHRVKKENDASHDKWIGVGGKCEADESPDECMLREVREETGFTVTSWRYRGIVTFISDVWPCEYMHLFTADHWYAGVPSATDSEACVSPATGCYVGIPPAMDGQALIDCNEGVLQWIDKEQLFNLTLWPGDRIFLRLIMDASQPFFSLKLVYRGDELVSAKLDGKPYPL